MREKGDQEVVEWRRKVVSEEVKDWVEKGGQGKVGRVKGVHPVVGFS